MKPCIQGLLICAAILIASREARADMALFGGRERLNIRMHFEGLEKYPEYGYIEVDPRTGDVLTARMKLRNEAVGAKLPWQQLKARLVPQP